MAFDWKHSRILGWLLMFVVVVIAFGISQAIIRQGKHPVEGVLIAVLSLLLSPIMSVVPTPLESSLKFRLRNKTLERIRAGYQVILDELKPTKAQIERGLEIHFNSYVADVQGAMSVSYIGGISGNRLQNDLQRLRKNLEKQKLSQQDYRQRLAEIHWKWKTFESAFDPQWVEESRALYDIAGVHLVADEAAGPSENTFEDALERIARNNFIYERRDDLIRVSGVEDIKKGRCF